MIEHFSAPRRMFHTPKGGTFHQPLASVTGSSWEQPDPDDELREGYRYVLTADLEVEFDLCGAIDAPRYVPYGATFSYVFGTSSVGYGFAINTVHRERRA